MLSYVIWYLIVGAVAGWISGQFVRGHGLGIGADIIVGIIGAFIGGFLFSLLGITTYGILGSLITSTIGAVILLWLMRLFSGNPTQPR